MRPVLMRLLLDHPWQLWSSPVTEPRGHQAVGGMGIALFVAILGGLSVAWILWRRGRNWTADDKVGVQTWIASLILLTFIPPLLPERLGRWFPTPLPGPTPEAPPVLQAVPITSLPIFGYGTFVLIGFLVAKWVGERRAERAGYDPLTVFDLTFWTLILGVLGGRAFYVIQYASVIFGRAQSVSEMIFNAINLSNGGLVLIGAMLGGAVGFFGYCRSRGMPALTYLDLLTPSIFIGIAFGRLGCLMYGCCFGDPCTLPWAISFPPESAAYETLRFRGFLAPHAAATMPLHPTQIYSSFNGALLALVTYAYYPYRARNGQVFALGMVLYALTRFFIEYVRADELGQLNTGLTISQLLCLAMAAGGILLAWRLQVTGEPRGRAPVAA